MEVKKDLEDGKGDTYSRKEIGKVRNSLIVMGSIRLGRRATELSKMRLKEVEDAEERMVNNKKFHLVCVKEQKTTSTTGEPATVSFNLFNISI